MSKIDQPLARLIFKNEKKEISNIITERLVITTKILPTLKGLKENTMINII